ncbi:MAG: Mov34/MPN/PAD-1 family protein [Halobacteriaceae archaeon]
MILIHDSYIKLLEHSSTTHPREACGILAGRTDTDTPIVECIYETANIAENPRREYQIDPSEQLHILEEIDQSPHQLIGFYHSHPHGPRKPSTRDQHDAQWDGYYHLLIANNRGMPYVDAWLWTGDEFKQVPITIESQPSTECTP